MPVLKSAIKKLRVDRKRASYNLPVKSRAKSALKAARQKGDSESVAKAFSALDKAVKRNLLKKRGAARLKSRLVKMIRKSGKPSPFAK